MNAGFRMVAPIASVIFLAGCQEASLPKTSYPPTAKGDVVDDYFGTKIADPYRWMEDLDAKPVAEWVAGQNKVTFDYLAKLPMREHFKQRITELWNYPKVSVPQRRGERYVYSKNSGLQRQAPIYMRTGLTGPPALVLDPNVLSPDGSLSLAQWEVSDNGRMLVYGLSEGGADWRAWTSVYALFAFLSAEWPWKVRVGANSPNLWPIISSETSTGTCLWPL